MRSRLFAYFDPDEFEPLAGFLVEVLGLEEAIKLALSAYYAAPEHREDFERRFLDRMTFGSAVERLGPVLDYLGVGATERTSLRNLVEIRNIVAHGLPVGRFGQEFDEIPEGTSLTYETRDGPVRVQELERYAVQAVNLRTLITNSLEQLGSPTTPTN